MSAGALAIAYLPSSGSPSRQPHSPVSRSHRDACSAKKEVGLVLLTTDILSHLVLRELTCSSNLGNENQNSESSYLPPFHALLVGS